MKTTRRTFLKHLPTTAGTLIIAPSVLGVGETVAPNSRVRLAAIGVGGQGTHNLRAFLQDERVQVVAVCDVDAGHREHARNLAKLNPADAYNDFREVIARSDIDAVMIGTPDHWHALITLAAARAGKDIFCEKPLAGSIGEGRLVSDVVRKEKRVLQCGTWRRSRVHVRLACEWVRNGYIGELQRIEVGVPGKFRIKGGYSGTEATQPIPKELDYDRWLGPAADAPYTAARCHFNFRWVNEYAPGYITDWGAHFIDVAHWGMNADDTNPTEVSASKVGRREHGIYNAPEVYEIKYRYTSGIEMTMFSTTDRKHYGTKFIGSEGSILSENQTLITDPPTLRRTKLKESDTRLYASVNHHRNFIDCVFSRERTASTVESAHRAGSACHLGAIATDLGRSLTFDPVKERFVGDDEANARVTRTYRAPWKLI
jgi:predicted dehydrogenase